VERRGDPAGLWRGTLSDEDACASRRAKRLAHGLLRGVSCDSGGTEFQRPSKGAFGLSD